jgi:hypothetical protein
MAAVQSSVRAEMKSKDFRRLTELSLVIESAYHARETFRVRVERKLTKVLDGVSTPKHLFLAIPRS